MTRPRALLVVERKLLPRQGEKYVEIRQYARCEPGQKDSQS